jgi:predicted dehydrogenase
MKINLAIIGLEEGLSILHAAYRSPAWNIAAICDLNTELMEKRKLDYGLSSYSTDDYNSILNDKTIDVIAIFTPDHLHAEHAVAALEAGKHVILTKPIAPNVADASRIKAACEKHPNQVFFAAHTSRFIPSMVEQRVDYLKGKIGKLIAVETEYNADKRQRSVYLSEAWPNFSPLHIWLVHPVDIALWYLGDVDTTHIVTRQSSMSKRLGLSQPDNYVVSLTNSNGLIALAKGFYSSPEPHRFSCILRGEEGYSVATYPEMTYEGIFDKHPDIKKDYRNEEDYYNPFGNYSYHVGEMQNILDECAECIRKKTPPSVDIEAGCLSVQILDNLIQTK